MIVVFAAFTFGDFLVVKMIGFTLAIAVLIDATFVRIVIGPALLRIAGDWNWWPGGLATPIQNQPEKRIGFRWWKFVDR
jgi:RND superfamily putative drug exporter